MPRRNMKDYVLEKGGLHVLRGRSAPDEPDVVWQDHSTIPGLKVPVENPPAGPVDPLMSRMVTEGDQVRFRCQCGRLVSLEDMTDLDNPAVAPGLRVAGAVRAAVSIRMTPATTRRFACDGCWTHWIRSGLVARDAFRQAIGAPPLPPGRTGAPW